MQSKPSAPVALKNSQLHQINNAFKKHPFVSTLVGTTLVKLVKNFAEYRSLSKKTQKALEEENMQAIVPPLQSPVRVFFTSIWQGFYESSVREFLFHFLKRFAR